MKIVAAGQIGGKLFGRHIEQHDLNAVVLEHAAQKPFQPAPSRLQPLIKRMVQNLAHQRRRFFPFEIGKPIDVFINRVGLEIVQLGRIELERSTSPSADGVVEPRGDRFEHVVERVERDLDRFAGEQLVARPAGGSRCSPAAEIAENGDAERILSAGPGGRSAMIAVRQRWIRRARRLATIDKACVGGLNCDRRTSHECTHGAETILADPPAYATHIGRGLRVRLEGYRRRTRSRKRVLTSGGMAADACGSRR